MKCHTSSIWKNSNCEVIVIKIELYSVFESTISLFEAITIILFLLSINDVDIRTKQSKKKIVLGSIGLWGLNMLLTTGFHYEGILGIGYIIFEFVYIIFVTGNKWYNCLFTSVLGESIILCINALISSTVVTIYPVLADDIYDPNKISRTLIILIVQTLHVYCFILINRIHKERKHSLKVNEWALVSIVFLLSFSIIALIHVIELKENISLGNQVILLSVELIIVLMNLVLLYIIEALSKSNIEAMNTKLENQQRQYVLQYSEEVKQQYNDIRRIRHDMKYTLTALNALMIDENYQAAYELIRNDADKIDRLNKIADFGNDFVNAVMNSKMQLAHIRDIKIICHATKINTNIDSADLCSLLGNIMDNAIEASDQCAVNKKYIEIAIRQNGSRLDIKISNSIRESVLKQNTSLTTHKADKNNHGFGVENIRACLKTKSCTKSTLMI